MFTLSSAPHFAHSNLSIATCTESEGAKVNCSVVKTCTRGFQFAHSSFIFFVEVKIILSAPRNIMRGKFNDFFLDTKTRWAQDVVSDCEAITLVHVGAKYISLAWVMGPLLSWASCKVRYQRWPTIPTPPETDNQGHPWTPAFLT